MISRGRGKCFGLEWRGGQLLYFNTCLAGLKSVVTHCSLAMIQWPRRELSSLFLLHCWRGIGERESKSTIKFDGKKLIFFYNSAIPGGLPSTSLYHCCISAPLLLSMMLPLSRFFPFTAHVNDTLHGVLPNRDWSCKTPMELTTWTLLFWKKQRPFQILPKTYSENLANSLKKSVFYFQLHHLITSYYNLSLNFFFCKWIICYLSCLRGLRSCWCKNLHKKFNHYPTEVLMWAYFMFITRQVLLKIRVSSCLFYIFPNTPHNAIITEMFNIC